MPLDFRKSPSQELNEILHGDATGAVGAIRTRLHHSLLQEFLQSDVAVFQAVIVGGRGQAFDHVYVDLVGTWLTDIHLCLYQRYEEFHPPIVGGPKGVVHSDRLNIADPICHLHPSFLG